MRFATWLLSQAVALAAATWLVGGIWFEGATQGSEEFKDKIIPLLIVAAILGAVSAWIKPVLQILSIPFIIVTLGLFLLVINAAMLGLAAWVAGWFDLGFHVSGFWAAIWGSIIISLVGWGMNLILEDA
ncbi:MAG: phage holin family protein [Nocardioides sp.]